MRCGPTYKDRSLQAHRNYGWERIVVRPAPLTSNADNDGSGLLKWSTDDGSSEIVSIAASVSVTPDGAKWAPAADGVGDAFASLVTRLRWGTGAIVHEAEIDIRTGVTFSVLAGYVEASAVMLVPAGLTGGPFRQQAEELRVRLCLTRGTRPGRSRPTFTYPRVILNNSAARFPVPPFAHAANIFCNAEDTYAAMTVTHVGRQNELGAIILSTSGLPYREALGGDSDGVPLAGQCRGVNVSSPIVGDRAVTVSFSLNL